MKTSILHTQYWRKLAYLIHFTSDIYETESNLNQNDRQILEYLKRYNVKLPHLSSPSKPHKITFNQNHDLVRLGQFIPTINELLDITKDIISLLNMIPNCNCIRKLFYLILFNNLTSEEKFNFFFSATGEFPSTDVIYEMYRWCGPCLSRNYDRGVQLKADDNGRELSD